MLWHPLTHLLALPLVALGQHNSGYHWAHTTYPFSLGVIKSIDNSGGNDWLGNFDWALEQWSRSEALDLVALSDDSSESSGKDCPSAEGFVRVCNADYGVTDWSGMAEWSYYIDGKENHNHIKW
jgi:hypothetical protein